jgi:2-amino-4-hydroxy-6-hydroxymethyldihydropteridine diphosphokinase
LAEIGRLVAVSSIYETEPWGDPDQPLYLNMCCALETDQEPLTLLRAVKQIEHRLGRRPTRRWGPRPIDIDLLAYETLEIDTPELILPHPRIAERAFVLAPLAEIAPTLRLSGHDRDVTGLLASLPDAPRLARLVGHLEGFS